MPDNYGYFPLQSKEKVTFFVFFNFSLYGYPKTGNRLAVARRDTQPTNQNTKMQTDKIIARQVNRIPLSKLPAAPKTTSRPNPVIINSDEWREYVRTQELLSMWENGHRDKSDDMPDSMHDRSDFGGM